MLTLPHAMVAVLMPFATLFSKPTWTKAQLLLVGALLTTGQRTVAQARRVMGRRLSPSGQSLVKSSGPASHGTQPSPGLRPLPRGAQPGGVVAATGGGHPAGGLLLQHLGPGGGPLVFGIDETPERRRGPRIAAKRTYRDAARSHRGHVVKAIGLRRVSLMWLGSIPWVGWVWALPFRTVPAPSEPYYTDRGRQPKQLTDWARQMILQLRRWLPDRDLVVVGHGAYAALDPLHCCRSPAPMVGPSHRPHHSRPAGLVLPGNPGRPPTATFGTHALSSRCLVPQTQAHFQLRPGPGALPPVASH